MQNRLTPVRCFLVLVLAISMFLGVTVSLAQTAATGSQDKRDLGIQPNQQPTPQAGPGKGKEAKPELVLQTGYNNFWGATRLGFSPDGRLLATGTFRSNTIKLWETATGRELRDLSTGGQNTSSLSPVFAFSPDGRLLAAAGSSNSVKIWEVASGRELQTLAGAQGSFIASFGVTYLGFTVDGTKLVTISDAIRVWDTRSWAMLSSLQQKDFNASGYMGGGGGVALTPDSKQLARVDVGQVKFMDLVSGAELRTVSLPEDKLENVELGFTSDGHLLVAGKMDKKVRVWDTVNKAERVSAPIQKTFIHMEFSGDGRLFALCDTYTIRIWEVATGRELPAINVPNTGLFLDTGGAFVGFTNDGKKIATGGFGTQTYVWETETGKQLQQMKGRTNMAYGVAFSADGTQLTSGARTRWDLRTGQGRRISSSAPDKFLGIPSPDGKLIAMFTPNDSTVMVVDAASGRTLGTLNGPTGSKGVEKVFFSPDGRNLAVTYSPAQGAQMIGRLPSSEVKIWDAQAGREIRTLTLSMAPAVVGFSPDNHIVMTVAMQGEITLWDLASGQQLQALTTAPGQTNPYARLSSMPTVTPGKMNRKQIQTMIANMPSQADLTAMMTNMMGTLQAGTSGRTVTSVSFSPDGKILASGGVESKSNFDPARMAAQAQAQATQKKPKNQKPPNSQDILDSMKIETTGQIVFWNPATGQELGVIKGHGKGVTDVVFSHDGKLIASAASDNTIKIWDVASQHELKTLTGHTANIESMDFSPDGKLLASASDDGSTFLWDTATGEHLLTLISLDDGGEWMVVTPDGLFDGTPQSWNQILWRYNQDTFNIAPVEWFFNEFYYPGLLSEVFAGKRPKVAQDISRKDRRQPIVKLTVDGATDNVSARTVKVKIDIADAAPDSDHRQGSGARDVRLFRNGSLVKVWHGDVLKGQPTATLEHDLTVVAGPNRLTAYAFNSDNVKSKDADLVLNGADSLKRAGTAWIIAVGVNEYANNQYNLKYAVADAQSFAAEVKRQQTQVGKFANVEVIPLLNDQATKANIVAALQRLSGTNGAPTLKAEALDKIKRAEPEDAVIIYFAGHGTAQGQRFYLIPHDLGYTGDRSALDAAGLNTILAHSISDQELEDSVEGLPAGSLLMVIDACNSGQALEAEEKRRGPMNSKGLAQLAYEKGMYILTAAQSYQAALEAAQLGHGLLTYALVEEGLKSAAADNEPRDGVVDAREWLDFATERVPQMQEEKMKQSRDLGLNIAFTEGEQKADPEKRSVQRPRVFYRREMESNPLVVAKPGTQ